MKKAAVKKKADTIKKRDLEDALAEAAKKEVPQAPVLTPALVVEPQKTGEPESKQEKKPAASQATLDFF